MKSRLAIIPVVLLLTGLFCSPEMSLATPGRSNHDTTYYNSYLDQLTTRLYEVTKFNSIRFIGQSRNQQLIYRPNTNINLGFGFNYRGLGINLGFNFPFINNDQDIYGETRHFNADANVYLRKVVMTAFFQTYRGYYSSRSRGRIPSRSRREPLTIRPDLRSFFLGVSGTYILNHRKVSYRAAFTQDEWQKKSAGSFLVGGFLTYTGFNADSALIPSTVNQEFNLNGMRLIDVGPQLGYMATIVLRKHWFVTFSLSAGAGVNFNRAQFEDRREESWTAHASYRWQGRFAMGYNSRRTYIGIAYVDEQSRVFRNHNRLGLEAGNFRINLIHRFKIQRTFVDHIMDWFPLFFAERTQ